MRKKKMTFKFERLEVWRLSLKYSDHSLPLEADAQAQLLAKKISASRNYLKQNSKKLQREESRLYIADGEE